jgi:hypothetical protein
MKLIWLAMTKQNQLRLRTAAGLPNTERSRCSLATRKGRRPSATIRRMNRPSQTRAVYLELRRALGGAFSAGELLRLAASLIAAYKLDRDDRDYGGYAARDAFAAAAVDKAMMDGGWTILDFEYRAGMPMSDDIPDNQLAIEARIKGIVGRAEWPRIEMAWL